MTRAFLALVALCGVAEADAATVSARIEESVLDRDVDATRVLLAENVTVGPGVRFANPACDKRGRVSSRVLATCLVKEGLTITKRTTRTPNAALVTFSATGTEIEMATADGLVVALDTPSRRDLPALSPPTLEALRTAGTTQLDDVVAARIEHAATVWLEVCLDKTGNVTSTVVGGNPHAGRVFRVAIADWRFRPYTLRSIRIPVCALVALRFPSAKTPAIQRIPAGGTTPDASTLTKKEVWARYITVGWQLKQLGDRASALWPLYRRIRVNDITSPEAIRSLAAELAAIERGIDEL